MLSHPDYLGHTEFVSDANGDAYQYFWYSPFGDALVNEHANTASFGSRYLFNAKELDPETGRYYYGARYYDPGLSIWLSVDPMAGRLHNLPLSPYHFNNNNPINIIDPDGRDWFVNGKTGDLVYAGGVSDVSDLKNQLCNTDDWYNFGPDDMFGCNVQFEGSDVLNNAGGFVQFGEDGAQQFMAGQGYYQGYESSVTDRAIIDVDFNIGEKQEIGTYDRDVTSERVTYLKHSENGVPYNDSKQSYPLPMNGSWDVSMYDVKTFSPVKEYTRHTNSALSGLLGGLFYSSASEGTSEDLKNSLKLVGKAINYNRSGH